MGIQAGILNEPISIYHEVKTKNEYGANAIEYQYAYSTRAKVEHASGNKSISERELLTHYTKTFTVRYYHDIKDTDRVLWNDIFWQIISIEPNRERQEKTIIAEKVNQ